MRLLEWRKKVFFKIDCQIAGLLNNQKSIHNMPGVLRHCLIQDNAAWLRLADMNPQRTHVIGLFYLQPVFTTETPKTKIEKLIHLMTISHKNCVCPMIWVLFCRQILSIEVWLIFFLLFPLSSVFSSLPDPNHT